MRLLFILSISGVLSLSACNVPGTGKPKLANEVDSISYALGSVIATNISNQLQNQIGIFDTLDQKMLAKAFATSKVKKEYLDYVKEQLDSISEEVFMKGFMNQLTYGKNGVYNDMMADGALREKNSKVRARKEEEARVEAQVNLEAGQKFLEANKQNPGIVVTESGLQYQIISNGNGDKPTDSDNVKCIYHGTLLDGTVFDSSKERGDTATFNVKGVIKGWTEALMMMPVGSKWKLFVPAELAYGERAMGKIKPNSTLIFEVELIDIVKKK